VVKCTRLIQYRTSESGLERLPDTGMTLNITYCIFMRLSYPRMLKPVDQYFQQKEEPVKSCLLFLREHILKSNRNVTEAWKYGMPFYCYNGRMFCYLWVHKKYKQPYIGIVEGKKIDHPKLIQEKRARMKIMLFDPARDIPVKTVSALLKVVIGLYKN
jgi:hypothetical protein